METIKLCANNIIRVKQQYLKPFVCKEMSSGFLKKIVRVSSIRQIDLLKDHSYSIGPCEQKIQKSLKKQLHKNIDMNEQWKRFLNL